MTLVAETYELKRFGGFEAIADGESRPALCLDPSLQINYVATAVHIDASGRVASPRAGMVPHGYRVGCREFRRVAAGRMISGRRHLPSADLHSMAVTKIRLTGTIGCFLKPSLLAKTFMELSSKSC